MNGFSPALRHQSDRLIVAWASIGVVLGLAIGIEAFILLRAWKRGAPIETRPAAQASTVVNAGVSPKQEPVPTPAQGEPPARATRKSKRPLNDDFFERIALDTPAHVTTSNVGASNERGEHMQNTKIGLVRWGDTIWWKWTAPMSGPVTIDTSGSSFDTYLTVYTGPAVNTLKIVAENDNASEVGVGESLVTFDAVEGTEYEVQVGGVFTGGGAGSIPVRGDVQLNLVMGPAVTIDAPAAGSHFPLPGSIAVSASAKSLTGAITNVSLYRGQTLLGRVSQPPYNFMVSNAPLGTNLLYVVASDSTGQAGTSAVRRVLVAGTGLTITSPADDDVVLNAKAISLAAFPMLPAGVMTNIAFYSDGQLIARMENPSSRVLWSSVPGGSHRIGARGWDDAGKVHEATPISIRVAHTFFPTGSVWRYLDNGSDQGTHWRNPTFNDSAWKSGPGELGYGDGDEATVVEDNATPGFNQRDKDHYITTYFRLAFVANDVTSYSQVLMNVKRDDGAVVYLNGREAARFNMTADPVDYITLARNAGDDGKIFFPATVPASFLVEGTNVVAVEIHQATGDSTDISFEMDMKGIPIRR